MGSRWMRNSFVYLLILVAVIAIVVAFFRPSSSSTSKEDFSAVIRDAKAGTVQKTELNDNDLKVTVQEGDTKRSYTSRKEASLSLVEALQRESVDWTKIPIEVKEPSRFGDWVGLLVQFLPILIFIGLILFMMRQAQGSN